MRTRGRPGSWPLFKSTLRPVQDGAAALPAGRRGAGEGAPPAPAAGACLPCLPVHYTADYPRTPCVPVPPSALCCPHPAPARPHTEHPHLVHLCLCVPALPVPTAHYTCTPSRVPHPHTHLPQPGVPLRRCTPGPGPGTDTTHHPTGAPHVHMGALHSRRAHQVLAPRCCCCDSRFDRTGCLGAGAQRPARPVCC